MEPKKSLKDRYIKDSESNFLTEHPKTISRKRVLARAWTWFRGNGATRICIFTDALRESWKCENSMIKHGGAIYHPYIMAQNCENQY